MGNCCAARPLQSTHLCESPCNRVIQGASCFSRREALFQVSVSRGSEALGFWVSVLNLPLRECVRPDPIPESLTLFLHILPRKPLKNIENCPTPLKMRERYPLPLKIPSTFVLQGTVRAAAPRGTGPFPRIPDWSDGPRGA